MKVALSPHAALRTLPPGERHELQVGGVRTCYWTYGPAQARETIVMVHGFRGDHHGLEPLIAYLRKYRVVDPDLPGFGESAAFADREHSFTGYADWLTAFVAQLLDAPPVVLGHSFGSMVVAAALAHGLPARRVVLVNPVLVGEAFAASVGDDISSYAARVDVPVLLVGGDRDDITRSQCTAGLSRCSPSPSW